MGYSGAACFVFRSSRMIKGGSKYFARYILVGLANTLIYGGLLWLFLAMDRFTYPISIAFAFSLAMIFQYLANKYYTFEVHSLSVSEVIRYFILAGLNYILSVLLVWIGLDLLNLNFLAASVVSACFVAGFGFLVSMLWVYKV